MNIDELWLATLTKDKDDAGTDADLLNVIVNIDGVDAVDTDFYFPTTDGPLRSGFGPDDENWLGRGQGALSGSMANAVLGGHPLDNPLDSNQLTSSSVRVGNRSDDAWGPSDILLFGTINAGADEQKETFVALAMETEIERWLSTDHTEGKLTMSPRLVGREFRHTHLSRITARVYSGSVTLESNTYCSLPSSLSIDRMPVPQIFMASKFFPYGADQLTVFMLPTFHLV